MGLRVDGPYGAPAEDVFENEIAVLIGTGIGVTPWASILKNIWHLRNEGPRRLQRIEFIWICRDVTCFAWFQNLLLSLEDRFKIDENPQSPSFLRIHMYLTQRINIDMATNICLNSVGFHKDPLTELKSRCHYGRPNFHKLFQDLRDSIENHTYLDGLEASLRMKVGVYFCGPSVVARQVREACQKSSNGAVLFNFRKEHFF